MATMATTKTIKHGCGHSWVWQFSGDSTPAEIRKTEREFYRQCPDCHPVAWFSDPRWTTRPLHRVERATPVATVAPATAPVAAPVVSARPARRLATMKQLDYLARLGVVVPADRQLTIEDASAAIDEARRGGSVGWLGLFYVDGDN